MRNGRGWGQDATLLPPAGRIWHATLKAASDPKTWAPLAGAAFLGVSGLDQEVSGWAYENTPVFGSMENAMAWSDDLLLGSKIIWISTTVITPSGNNLPEIAFAKFKGIAIEALAVSATRNLTGVLKKSTKRVRPNGSDDDSFPSAHASHSFVYSALAHTNIEAVALNDNLKKTLDVGIIALASATAWARVEAKLHYPSDVLAGMALGNFMALFFTEAFMGLDKEAPLGISLIHTGNETVLRFQIHF